MKGFVRFGSPLIDQALVSGGSFLTIVISARILSLSDQGKLGYIVAAYLATIIINTTAIFQWANVQAPVVADKEVYRSSLAGFQVVLAALSAVCSTGIVMLLSSFSGWAIVPLEAAAMAIFLFTQQLADFDRRSSYVFFNAKRAAVTSFSCYVPRIVFLALIRPSNIVAFVALMSLASFLPAVWILISSLRARPNLKMAFSFFTGQPAQARWLMASAPLVWIWATLPVFFVGGLLSMENVGIFITIRSFANVSNVAMELLETEVSASAGKLYVSSRDRFYSMFRKTRLIGGVFWIIGAFVILFFGSRILEFIYGATYSRFSNILLVLWTANGIIFLFRLNAVILRTTEKCSAVTLGYLTAIIIMTLSSYPVITGMGITGAALMFCIGAFTNFASQTFLSQRAALGVSG